jgi:hypothetical protein
VTKRAPHDGSPATFRKSIDQITKHRGDRSPQASRARCETPRQEIAMKIFKCAHLTLMVSLSTTAIVAPSSAQQPQQKPNILVIMADDIGYWNISAYNRGMMGYHTAKTRFFHG